MLLLLTGCTLLGLEDPILYQALDYTIDRPRVLGIATDHTNLSNGVPVALDALALGPGGAQATEGTWKACGLSATDPAQVWGLDCFGEDLDVQTIASGAFPATWLPPDLPEEACADPDACAWSVPVLLETSVGGEAVRGTFSASILAQPDFTSAPSLRETALLVTAGPASGGQVALTATLARDTDLATFRWYVDGGTLLDTGRTNVQAKGDGEVTSANRWILPEGKGPFRVAVVVSGNQLADTYDPLDPPPDTGMDTGAAEAPPPSGDMTWTVTTVTP